MSNSDYSALDFGAVEQPAENLGKRLWGFALTALSRVFGKSAEEPAALKIEYRMPRPEDFTTDLLEETEAGGGYQASRSGIRGLQLVDPHKEDVMPVTYNSWGLPRPK